MTEPNIVWHTESVSRNDQEKLLHQKGVCLWFTGLSGSGKSTLAQGVSRKLYDSGHFNMVLDGDNIRHGLCKDIGFSEDDRIENIRRISEVSRLLVQSGVIVLTAFISPFRSDRNKARTLFHENDFLEIFVDCPLEICQKRDPKGLYQKAKKGEIKNFTGIDSPYEEPHNPELHLKTEELSFELCINEILLKLKKKGNI